METKDITNKLVEEARRIEKLDTLKAMEKCIDAIMKKEVTIKYVDEDAGTRIYIGGEYFQTMPGSQWARIVNLVIDVTGKAYAQGANDVVKDMLEHIKER